jgi:hypothetical protein
MSARVLSDWELSVPLSAEWEEGLEAMGETPFDSRQFDSASGQPLLTLTTRYLDLSRVLREPSDTAFEILQPRPLSPRVL